MIKRYDIFESENLRKDIDPYGEEDWEDQNAIRPVQITLKQYQVDLLLRVLKENEHDRSVMQCNDISRLENDMIPRGERVDFLRNAYNDAYIEELMDENDGDVEFFNLDIPRTIRKIIQNQVR